ncbi:UNVERIFIED_CONTAM: hypothetical protein Slati_2992700 [Sesamum latifolium]|uniref:Uncharacterized protein n=1 Tax=Sesamum latifolium TaxID=2727402 RepID=A0AAW2VEW7_9LAMI
MPCFRRPDYLLHEIEMMIANFWWHNQGEHQTHWIGWTWLCQPRETGGLGFKEMKVFNRAMLAKQGWRLITQPNALLSRILKAKYFPDDTFLNARMGARPLLTWRSIIGARDLLLRGCRWRIEACVDELIDRSLGCWRYNLIQQVFDVDDVQLVLGISLTDMERLDEIIWPYTSKGQFSVHNAYQLELRHNQQLQPSTSTGESEDGVPP